MKEFLLDKCPNFGETKVTLQDKSGKSTDYKLHHVKNDGYILTVESDGTERDAVVFTRQDLKALFLLLTVCPPKP